VLPLVDVPFDEERQLRIFGDVVEPDLAPPQVEPVRPSAVAGCGAPLEPRFDVGHVVDPDGPGQPPAALGGAGADRAAERSGIDSGMVENANHLQVAVVREWQHEIPGAEGRMNPTVGEGGPQPGAEPLHRRGETVGSSRVREMVQTHRIMVS
jgi:hypothetical protein